MTLNNDNSKGYLILLESLVCTNDIENIVIYIVGESTELQNYIDVDMYLKSHNIKYLYFQFPEYLLKGLCPSAAFVIFSSYVLPDNIDKIIFLNSNLILKDCLVYLWEYDLEGHALGACEDRWISHGVDAEELNRVEMSETDTYFNTDVLVINLSKLRKSSLTINNESCLFELKSYINKYLAEQVGEIADKRYNTQLMSYLKRERKEKYDEAFVINYGKLSIWKYNKEEIDANLYNLWWKYAKQQQTYNEIFKRIKKKEKKKSVIETCQLSMDYLRFALGRMFNSQIDYGRFKRIDFFRRSGLWDSFYFTNKKYFEYEKKYKNLVRDYEFVQIHRFVGGSAGIFFLTLICYKIMRQNDNVFHIFIPATMMADSSADKSDFYVHNEYILKYFDKAYIPQKSDIDFLRFIISKNFYRLDFSLFAKFSPVAYEKAGGDYKEIENVKVIDFSEDEIKRGEQFLRQNDIGEKFVCIAPRNSEYKKSYMESISPNDYLTYRNGSIESYLKAVEVIQSLGYSLIQMGKVNKNVFPKQYGILNFSEVYDEFLDIYLFSRCEFVIGDASGIMKIADLFAKPTIQANNELITTAKEITGYFREGKDIILPVKYWSAEKKRYLTLREQLELEVKYKDKRFEEEVIRLGYRGISNSAEEIGMAVREMLDVILGKKEYTENERHLQKVSRSMILQSAQKHSMLYPRCNFAVGFLELNPWYLD